MAIYNVEKASAYMRIYNPSAWIGLNIIIPLTLLRLPIVQKYLVELEGKLPFDIPGVG